MAILIKINLSILELISHVLKFLEILHDEFFKESDRNILILNPNLKFLNKTNISSRLEGNEARLAVLSFINNILD